MLRRYPRFLAFVVGVALTATGAAAVAGCGTPAASPEHLGRWYGYSDTVALTITVAGTPDHYTAQLWAEGRGGQRPRRGRGTFHGGEADTAGNVVFDTRTFEGEGQYTTFHLTLGPVSGDAMTVTFHAGDIDDSTVDVRRQ